MSTVATIREAALDETAPDAKSVRPAFASAEAFDDFDKVAQIWSDLLPQALATPYQSPAILRAWAEHVGPHEGVRPLIVVARDGEGRPVALLPLGVRRRMGIATARFLGGTHANYNMPVLRRDRLALFTPSETRRLLAQSAAVGRVDAFVLTNQPHEWDGVANPLAALPRQPSPDCGYRGPLAPTLEEHLKTFVSAKTRSAQRRKMRRFEERGAPRLYRAATTAERARILDVYFAQKAERLASRGIDNVFERPGVRDFIAAAAGLDGGPQAIDLYGFDLDGDTLATFGTISDGVRLCGMFNSIASGELSRYSPGELLLNFMVEDAIGRGLKTFDLGVGTAAYKAMYCPEQEPLFDSIFGVTAIGRAVATAFAAKNAAKARIKANPTAYGLVTRLRRMKADRRKSGDED
jgi:CelD/BcsL family acetyltransferase involved in cellulose biosynthesis